MMERSENVAAKHISLKYSHWNTAVTVMICHLGLTFNCSHLRGGYFRCGPQFYLFTSVQICEYYQCYLVTVTAFLSTEVLCSRSTTSSLTEMVVSFMSLLLHHLMKLFVNHSTCHMSRDRRGCTLQLDGANSSVPKAFEMSSSFQG